jgi:PAS domain S-box-containing protein
MVTWWQLSMGATAVVGLGCFVFVGLLVVPLVRSRQLWTNRLAQAAVAIAFAFGLQRLSTVVYQVAGMLGPDPDAFAAAQRNSWWLAVIQLLVAGVALYYLLHRRLYSTLMIRAFFFDSFEQQQRVEALEAQQRLNEARLAAERERDEHDVLLQGVIQNSHALISVKDLQGRYLLVNEPFSLAFGVTDSDLLGATDRTVLPALAGVRQHADLLAQQGPRELEMSVDQPDGRHFYETATFPLRDADGAVYATGEISADVTDRRRAVTAIAEARDAALAATAAKSTFLATMSHEIRTPMNAVIGMTDLLAGTPLDDEQREFVDTVRSSGDALIGVINDILDFSKIESGELRLEAAPFDLRDEVEGCLDLVAAPASDKGLDLLCDVHEGLPEIVVGDVVRFRQVLTNLVANAVKFTERGEVRVTVVAQPAGEGVLRLALEVTDTGIGISSSALSGLFTSFSQADASSTRVYGGTGLGLAISRRLTEAMGGELTATSIPGGGSCFTSTLELREGQADEQRTDTVRAIAGRLRDRTVLLVDDNVTNLRILTLQLTGLGMSCTSAASAEEALALVDEGLSFEVAVLDLNMPVVSGLDLGRRLQQRLSAQCPPLVLLTGKGATPPDVERLFAATVTKPSKRGVLRDILVQLLCEPAERPQEGSTAVGGGEAAAAPANPPAGLQVSGLRVLVAEDNLVNQRVAQLMLARLGIEATIVTNGLGALEAVRQAHYDVVLMDVQMPTMDGLEATRRIRSERSDAERPFIVAMTASALVEDRDACTTAGMDDYLAKPVRADDLRSMLTRVAEAGSARETRQGAAAIA